MAVKSSLKDSIFKGLFQAADPDAVRQIAMDAAIIKALEVGSDGQEAGFMDGDRVIDQSIGAAGSRRLTQEEIKVGRPQSASGQGASRMIAEFSSPDPQQDIVENYNSLSRELGELKTAMKSMTEAFSAALVAAKADDDKDDKDDEMCKSDALTKADEIEDEDDDGDKNPFGKSEVALSGPAKAASTYIQAAEELDLRAKAARKSKDMDKARTLKSKVEKTLTKALSLLSAAPDKATPAVKGMVGDIHAAALVKGFTELAVLAAKAESDSATTEVAAKAQEHEHMQDKWPSGHGEVSSKAEMNVASKAELEAKLDAVLKGYAVQQGSLSSIMEAVMGKSQGDMPTIDLGLAAKSAAGATDPAALFKSNGDAWEALKMDQISAAIDSGEFKLDDEFACQAILSTASAVRAGAIPGQMLKSRVNASSEAIRSMFSEVLAA